jgi:hypothetical protein
MGCVAVLQQKLFYLKPCFKITVWRALEKRRRATEGSRRTGPPRREHVCSCARAFAVYVVL